MRFSNETCRKEEEKVGRLFVHLKLSDLLFFCWFVCISR